MDGWIDLGAFAAKYGVSQSTLRRRIRAKAIPFRMQRGKYLLQDSSETLNVAPLFSRQPGARIEEEDFDFESNEADIALEPTSAPETVAPIRQSIRRVTIATPDKTPIAQAAPATTFSEPLKVLDPVESFLNSNDVVPLFLREDYERLLVENRRLKGQIAELETLVKALEAELNL